MIAFELDSRYERVYSGEGLGGGGVMKGWVNRLLVMSSL